MDFDSVDGRDHRDHQTLRTALRCNDRGIVRISLCGCLLTFLRFIVREVEEASPIKTRKADYSSLLVFPSSLWARQVGSYPFGFEG